MQQLIAAGSGGRPQGLIDPRQHCGFGFRSCEFVMPT